MTVRFDSLMYGFQLTFNNNIYIVPNSAALQDIRHGNLSDLESDLSSSLKVKCDGAIGLFIYDSLLMYNLSNIGPYWVVL